MRITIEGSHEQIKDAARTIANSSPDGKIRKNESEASQRGREIQAKRKIVHRAWRLVRYENSERSERLFHAITGEPVFPPDVLKLAKEIISETKP